MNARDVAACLAMLEAAYPKHEVNEDTADLWIDHLAAFTPEDGYAAVHSLVRTQQWFPSLSNMIEACQNAARNRARNSNVRALAPSSSSRPVSQARGRAWVKAIREQLAGGPSAAEVMAASDVGLNDPPGVVHPYEIYNYPEDVA